jgi:hypothetical protein
MVAYPNTYAIAGTITESLDGIARTAEMWANNIIRMDDSGFYSWAAAAPYFDDSTLGTFKLLVGGTGYIKNQRITWVAQNITGLTAGSTWLIYIDSTGTIGKTATRTDALFVDNIVLFECLRDSTPVTNNQVTVKENHPYSFQAGPSNWMHDVAGALIENNQNGANIKLVGTQGIGISGADVYNDHGLETTIADTGGVGCTWIKMYTTAAGKWARQNATTTFTGYWNNAGTPTVLTANRWAVYTLYVCKDTLNVTTPTYFAVLNTAQYGTSAAASTAISNGTTSKATNELAELELCQLGYIIYRQSTATITTVTISKTTLRSTLSTGGTNTAALVNTDITAFNGWLTAADTNVQSALDTLDDVGLNVTPQYAVLTAGASYQFHALSVGATGTLLVGATGNYPAFGTSAVGDFTFTSATAAQDRTLTISNTDNTAVASQAHLQVTVGGSTSTGDPYTNFLVTGAGTYSVGIDNSDSDKFKITTGASPSAGTEILTSTSAGAVTIPGTLNVTTSYSINSVNCILRGSIATAADGTYYIAKSNEQMSGYFSICWDAGGRRDLVELFCDANRYNSYGTLSIVSQTIYSAQVLTNFRLTREVGGAEDGQQYITVDVGNRNGGAGPLLVTWYGEGRSSPTLAPTAPGAPTAQTTYGIMVNSTPGTVDLPVSRITAGGGTYLAPGANTLPVQSVAANAGNSVFNYIANTDNTNAASNAQMNISVGGSSAGDAYTLYLVSGTNYFVTGIDNSDSDKYKICSGFTMGTNDTIVATQAGEVTMPLQPAFLAQLSASDSNKTGRGEVYTVGSGNAFTEIFDQNADFNTNGTFTAPVTGRYQFSVNIAIGDISAATTAYLNLVTSNRSYYGSVISPTACKDVNVQLLLPFSVLADMDAADTAVLKITVNGEASTRIDILAAGAGDSFTVFSGFLAC